MSKHEALKSLIYEVALIEAELNTTRQSLNKRLQRIENSLIRPLKSAVGEIDSRMESLKRQIRELAQAAYDDDPEQPLPPAVTMARITKYKFDKEAAVAWAKEHAPQWVKVVESLDSRGFEKALRAGEFDYSAYEVIEELQVRISNLAGYADLLKESSDGKS